jgi:cytoskeletal protein CcmA (bactofilin family)
MNLSELNQIDMCVLTAGSVLKGEFTFSGLVSISSSISGKINVLNEGKMIIESVGKVDGTINCKDVEIFGDFIGEINASGRIILQPGCHVVGNLTSESLTIFPGAILNANGKTT